MVFLKCIDMLLKELDTQYFTNEHEYLIKMLSLIV
jgi:hypothetical protein